MRMRRKPNQESRIARCRHLLIANPEEKRGVWNGVFPKQDRPLHLELGCGKGRFTAETGKMLSDVNFIAIEKSSGALVTALERVAGEGLSNVLFINALADNLTDYFEPEEITRIYINFCDPWPSGRHEKRRLTGRRFLDLYKKILKRGGEIHFKTDNSPLFEYSLTEFENAGFTVKDVTRDLHDAGNVGIAMTDYEIKFHEQGVPINRCVAVNDG